MQHIPGAGCGDGHAEGVMATSAGNTLTLLFTDIVGSTENSARLGDEAAQSLRRAHDRIVREQVDALGGDVVKNTGDGCFATFGSARQGVECAAAIQRAVARQQAEGRYHDLLVRVGVHTGEPVLEDGDVFGIDVALATRVMSEAGGGEVLVSDITHLLARAHTSLPFVPLGVRQMKGVPEPVQVLRVDWTERQPNVRRLSRFVGRSEDRERLRRRLDAAYRGDGAVVLLAGEPGVGKSRLAWEAAVEARDRGMLVLQGRVFESESRPYHAVTSAMSAYLRERPAGELRAILGEEAAYVAKVLPELEAFTDPPPAPDSLGPEAERYRLFEALTLTLQRLAARTPVLLVIDDLHWADRATVHLVQHVMRRISHSPILLLATYRDLEVSQGDPVTRLGDELQRDELGERVTLYPLPRNEIAALVEDILEAAPAEGVVESLYAATAGNPFFTEEVVRLMREQAEPENRASATRVAATQVPESVRHILLRRFERLDESTRELLGWCSVIGSDLSVAVISSATGTPESSVLSGIEGALDGHVLREGDDGVCSFAHPLIQEILYQGLSASRRRVMHRHVALALEHLHAADRDSHSQELAHHFLEAGDEGAAKAIEYASRAAQQATAVFAYDEAAKYYRRAAGVLERSSDAAARTRHCQTLLLMGDALIKAGDAPAADAAYQAAAEAARRLDSAELLADAAIGLGDVRRTGGIVDQPLIDLLGEALQRLDAGDSELRARVLARYAAALYHVEPWERLSELSGETLAMARRLDDARTLIYVMRSVILFFHRPYEARARLESHDELIRLAERIGDRETALYARYQRMGLLVELGEMAEADAVSEGLHRDAEELRQPFYLWLLAVYRAMRALFAGRYEDGERLAQEAFALGREAQTETNLAFQFLAVQLYAMRWEQARLHELKPVVEDFVRQYPALRWRVGLGFLYSELGDEAAARAQYDVVVANDLIDIPDDFNQLIALTFLSDLCTRFDDAKRAALLYDRILPFDGLNAIIGAPAACAGAASRYLGMLAATMQRWDVAERHFEDALEMNERMGARPSLGRTKLAYASMLLRRQAPGDGSNARRLLAEADAEAHELGMVRLREEVAALLESTVTAS